MKAIRVINEKLVWTHHPTPEPGPGEVRIRVITTAVNRADLVQRSGRYPPPPGAPDTLGLECAGIIEAIGRDVTNRAVGDEVVALLTGGGYAEFATCPATHTLPRGALSWTDAAAVIEVFTTAWLNLKLEAQLQPGERVLLHAAASGVGTAALQLCRLWNNPVFATVGSATKQARCLDLGASATHDRHQGSFVDGVKQWGGADVVLCPVGGAYLEDNVAVLRRCGRLVIIGLLGGRVAELPLGPVLVKRLTVKGSVLRSRSIDEKNLIFAGLERDVWPFLQQGRLSAVVDQELPIEQAEQAHSAIASNQTIGKVVLRVGTP